MMTPQKAAASPAAALRNEIRTGMSAPPMRMAAATPSHIETAMSAIEPHTTAPGPLRPTAAPRTTRTASVAPVIAPWRGRTVGVPLSTPASLPPATRLPANVAAPSAIPSRPAALPTLRPLAGSRASSAADTRNAATPPAPCWNAIMAGICRMVIPAAIAHPSPPPAISAAAMTGQPSIDSRSTTTAAAMIMAAAAVRLPHRAPAGVRNWAKPAMKMTMTTNSRARCRMSSIRGSSAGGRTRVNAS